MNVATSAARRIESYMAQVRVAFRGLPEREIEDILRELRSHIAELAGPDGAGVEEALRSLGDPVDLAETYRSENQMVRAECSGSPLVILQGLRHAGRGPLGRITATVLYAFGYINVLTLWAAAIDKLFAPSRTGVWYTPGKIWWLAPIAVALGWILRYVTDRIARRWIGRYRRSKGSQEA